MFIAGITYARQALSDKYKTLGKLWYDPEEHRCSLLMHGFRMGQCFAKPYDNVENPPYLKGDINILTGEYEKGGILKKEYLWCGFMFTESDQRGAIYQIIFEVDPMPILCAKMINASRNSEVDVKPGVFLSVHLEDDDRNSSSLIKPEEEHGDAWEGDLGDINKEKEDNLPF